MKKALRIVFAIGLLLLFGTVGAGEDMTTEHLIGQAAVCLLITLIGFFGGRVYE